MTKQERMIGELIAIGATGALGAFAVPTLLSTRDSLAFLCGAVLFFGWVAWVVYFTHRAMNMEKRGGKK